MSGRWSRVVVAGAIGVAAILSATPGRDLRVDIGQALTLVPGLPARESAVEPVVYAQTLELLEAYPLDAGQPVGTLSTTARGLWASVEALYPAETLDRLSQFALATDGPGANLALVHRSEREPDRFILSIDPADSTNPSALQATLTHEMAHMLTITRADILFISPGEERPCDQVRMDLGCARSDSLLGQWWTTFWDPSTTVISGERFVTPYAGTSAAEDLAETFMVLVTRQPVPHSPIVDAKLAWVASQPDLAGAIVELQARLES